MLVLFLTVPSGEYGHGVPTPDLRLRFLPTCNHDFSLLTTPANNVRPFNITFLSVFVTLETTNQCWSLVFIFPHGQILHLYVRQYCVHMAKYCICMHASTVYTWPNTASISMLVLCTQSKYCIYMHASTVPTCYQSVHSLYAWASADSKLIPNKSIYAAG